jgi:diguanylate cyclase (GGDEF)-like protein
LFRLLTAIRSTKRSRQLALAISWLLYLLGVLAVFLFGSNLAGIPILLGALPVLLTGWCLGIGAGAGAALAAFLFGSAACVLADSELTVDYFRQLNPWVYGFLLGGIGLISGLMNFDHRQITQKVTLLDFTQTQLDRYSQLLSSLHALSTNLLRTKDWKDELPGILNQLGTAVNADHVYYLEIPELTSPRLTIQISHAWPRSPETVHSGEPQKRSLDLKKSHLSSWMLSAQEGFTISGRISDLSPAESALLSSLPEGAFNVFPIFGRQSIRGFLGIERGPRDQAWDQLEQELVSTFAQMLSSIVTRELVKENLHRQARELEILRRTTQRFADQDQLETILSAIVEQVCVLFPAQRAEIYLYRGGAFERLIPVEKAQSEQAPSSYPFHSELMEEVARRKKPLLIPDLNQLPLISQENHPFAQALISLPLMTATGLSGVFNIWFPDPHPFPENELQLFRLLASQASTAIHNARLYRKEKEQRSLAEALEKTGQILQSSLDPDTVLDKILAQIETVIPYDTANLMLVDGDQARVVRHQGYEKLDPGMLETFQKEHFDIDRFDTLQKMIQNREPLIISDTRADPQWVMSQTSSKILSWVGAPIIRDEDVIGFLSLNKFEKDFYQPEHGRRISAFAGQSAIALRHAQLYQAEAQRRLEAENLRRAQDSLLHISQTIGSSLDFEIISNLVVAYALDLLPVEGVNIFLRELDGNGYPCLTLDPEVENRMSIPLEELKIYSEYQFTPEESPLIRRLQTSQKTLVIPDVSESNLISSSLCQILDPEAVLASPLTSQNQLLGILLAVSVQPDFQFSEHQIKFFSGLADQTSVALERSRLFEEVKKLAETDQLTGALNRRGLDRWGAYEFERANRFDRELSVIFFDLDHFKKVNDSYGHDAGDQILKEMAERCQKVIRRVDLLVRYGGEEFLVILPETAQHEAYRIAERIRNTLHTPPYQIDEHTIEMTVSLGVKTLSEGIQSLEELINPADLAMYQAKQSGRNQTSL